MKASEIADLKWLHKNKKIIKKYEEPILIALKSYPELKDVCIHFKLAKKGLMPYTTKPTFSSLFKPADKRIYTVTIAEEASGPEEKALFKNLLLEYQIGVIAHELVHVLQYHSMSVPELIKTVFSYPLPFMKRQLERDADKGAIEHGFGAQLYKHALYIRSIPGYIQQKPEFNQYYLQPFEILLRLTRQLKAK
jgi:hypothetical protein